MLIFLKLGGSLITNKDQAGIARLDIITRLALEIAAARRLNADLNLVIGHGSGSFGHVAAKKYNTRQGVKTPSQWHGFAEVWKEARTLNQFVVEALQMVHLPVIAFPPSASVITHNGQIVSWPLEGIEQALQAGLIPLVMGDVVFDREMGGTILSTEESFEFLASRLKPDKILLAGLEAGVWADFPARTQLIPHITPDNYAQFDLAVGASTATDVTGGMAEKVSSMLNLIRKLPALQVLIFSGKQPGVLQSALAGNPTGTLISLDHP